MMINRSSFFMSYQVKLQKTCRACNSDKIEVVLPLRQMPPGDKYVLDKSDVPTVLLPSDIQLCSNCGHIQMSGFTDPDYIYTTYLSRPASTNPGLATVYQEYATELKELAGSGSVLEVGSNDGLFLENFLRINQKAVGIEPAKNLCKIADSRNVKTINGYVNEDTVKAAVDYLQERPKVILANHSFSNVEHIQDWALCLTDSLADDGYFVIQSFYQVDVLKNKLIENYNHEHLSYLTIDNFRRFMAKYGLVLIKVKRLEAKGGSIRFFFKKSKLSAIFDQPTLNSILEEEQVIPNLQSLFRETSEYVEERKVSLNSLLRDNSCEDSFGLCAYGTSIGATVFSYQFGIEDLIGCFFDDDVLRQNRYSPGTGKTVYPGRNVNMNIYKRSIILAPLYATSIISKNSSYVSSGGKFVKFWPVVEEVKEF